MIRLRIFASAVVLVGALAAPAAVWAQATVAPTCRLDATGAQQVETTLRLALQGFKEIGQTLPYDTVVVNPASQLLDPRTLAAYIVRDATVSAVSPSGCVAKVPATLKGEELDAHSVKGGCVAAASGSRIRCSADAVRVFGRPADGTSKQNPALLYVLSHELAHIAQGRPGEYAGRLQSIDLSSSREEKLRGLKEACEPGLTQAEEDADKQALQILERVLPRAPFREPLFSSRGSVLWGVDQLNLAAHSWSALALEREFVGRPRPHQSFEPTEFPTPAPKIQANSKRFVCEVLTKKKGVVAFPGRSSTHPALEVRIQRVAEALLPLAATLPSTDGATDYQPVAKLQRQLSEVFSFMYRGTGDYLQSVQSSVCTRLNSDNPTAGC